MSKEAMKLALEALKITQNNLAPSKHSAHAYGDGELWDMYADAIKALEEALAKQEQGEQINSTTSMSLTSQNGANHKQEPVAEPHKGEPVAHWSDCAVHSEPAYQAGECDCGGYSPDKELLDSATAFYNATVADSQVRISSSSQEKRDAAFNASERLRFALLAKLKATDEDLKVYQSIADNYFKDTTPQQLKPLTDEQILNVARDHYNPNQRAEISFARAIEAAHGIAPQGSDK
jgi:hypothetical protein